MQPQGVGERQADMGEMLRRMNDNMNGQLRVAMPGIVQAFNATDQTVTVLCAIRERIVGADKQIQHIEIPYLLDVPIVLPRAGGFAITFPVKAGDECLVIFGDMCINAWWSLGGVQNMEEYRRHDFSDGFAILGPWSKPHKISGYSTDKLVIKSEYPDSEGRTASITIDKQNNITMIGKTITSTQWGP